MNRKKAMEFLSLLLGHVLYHDLFFEELVDLLSGTGIEGKFFKLLTVRLKALASLGIAVVQLREFENIGGGLYSMHFSNSDFNIRILFGFLPNSQPVLLLPFYEKGGKSKTNYSSYITPAQTRLSEMKEDYERG